MSDCFSAGASVLVKIRTETKFFQCQPTVSHTNSDTGMTVLFRGVSPPFPLVLLPWLSAVLQQIATVCCPRTFDDPGKRPDKGKN